MADQRYDKSSKWLIRNYGYSILRLAGIEGIRACRALQAEVVQPRQLPDGLLEVEMFDYPEPDLFSLEIATYPERRVVEQLTRDMMLVYLDRGKLPEVVTVVLRPKGRYEIPNETTLASRLGFAGCNLRWRVVRLGERQERIYQDVERALLPVSVQTGKSARPTGRFSSASRLMGVISSRSVRDR